MRPKKRTSSCVLKILLNIVFCELHDKHGFFLRVKLFHFPFTLRSDKPVSSQIIIETTGLKISDFEKS